MKSLLKGKSYVIAIINRSLMNGRRDLPRVTGSLFLDYAPSKFQLPGARLSTSCLVNARAERLRSRSFRAAVAELHLRRIGKTEGSMRVTEYKFKIGQLVYFHPKAAKRPQLDAVPGPYQITKRLPAAEDGEFQYEIRNTLEEYNRVARESDLTRT